MAAGRPRKISSPEEFDRLVDAYLEECKISDQPFTLTGVILALGLSSRQSLDEYLAYEGFPDSVKRAKLLVEHGYEKGLHSCAAGGAIFALKNFGWTDKQQLEHSGRIDIANLSDDELEQRIAALQATKA